VRPSLARRLAHWLRMWNRIGRHRRKQHRAISLLSGNKRSAPPPEVVECRSSMGGAVFRPSPQFPRWNNGSMNDGRSRCNEQGTDVPVTEREIRNRNVSSGVLVRKAASAEGLPHCDGQKIGRTVVTSRKSRTYKLQLSPAGLACFIQCHARIVTYSTELIPYGMTLLTALIIFSKLDASDQSATYDGADTRRLWGPNVHFVGSSTALRELVEAICVRLENGDLPIWQPRVALIYAAALQACSEADVAVLGAAYQAARESTRSSR